MSDIRHYSEELQLLLDGRLDRDTARQLEAHLQDCAACRAEQREQLTLRAQLRGLGDAALPTGLQDSIRAALDADAAATAPAQLGHATTLRSSMLWRVAAGLAVMALGVFAPF